MALALDMIDLQKVIEKLFDGLLTVWLLDDL
jgi:hypothetical protein